MPIIKLKPDGLRSLVEMREFLRFFLTGITATVGNLFVVWLVRQAATYQMALLAGVFVGFCISFIMSKLFAFRSRSWSGSHRELTRFLIVYAVGVGCYFAIGLIAGRYILPAFMSTRMAEMGGAFLGAGSMMLTSYFGHRFFTYRSTRWPSVPAYPGVSAQKIGED